MAIPKFDRVGNIPIGDLFGPGPRTPLIETSLAEMKDLFVDHWPRSKTRPVIWAGWMQHRAEVEALGISYVTMIGGSFITRISEPKDIDFALIFDASAAETLLKSDPAKHTELERLTNTSFTKPRYRCDAYPIRMYPVSNPRFVLVAYYFNYWTRVFGIDRKGNQKAVLYLSERGTL